MNIAKDGRFVCYGPAGGGYGNPLERDPAKVADDVLDERDLGRDGAQGLWRRGVGEGRCRPSGNREGTRRAYRLRGGPLKAETRVRHPVGLGALCE